MIFKTDVDKIKITTGDGTQEGSDSQSAKRIRIIQPDHAGQGAGRSGFLRLIDGKLRYYIVYKYIITVYIIPSKILET